MTIIIVIVIQLQNFKLLTKTNQNNLNNANVMSIHVR